MPGVICAASSPTTCLISVLSLQGRMFSCSADCCDRSTDSMSQVHQCIERCHTPLAQAQGLVTSELEKFQVRKTRCPNTSSPVNMCLAAGGWLGTINKLVFNWQKNNVFLSIPPCWLDNISEKHDYKIISNWFVAHVFWFLMWNLFILLKEWLFFNRFHLMWHSIPNQYQELLIHWTDRHAFVTPLTFNKPFCIIVHINRNVFNSLFCLIRTYSSLIHTERERTHSIWTAVLLF